MRPAPPFSKDAPRNERRRDYCGALKTAGVYQSDGKCWMTRVRATLGTGAAKQNLGEKAQVGRGTSMPWKNLQC